MQTVKVVVARSNGAAAGSRLQEYYVSVENPAAYSVMNLLEEIYQKQDSTLAFFHHAACKQAACGKCLMKINGKVCLACKEPATETVVVEPWNENVVRDLICLGKNV